MKPILNNIFKKCAVFCAPLCGYTDFAFREVLSEFTPSVVFTEMLSVAGLKYNFKKTIELYKPAKTNSVLGIQLFGNNPKEFAEALKLINALEFDTIDINLGCSVRKVLKAGCGSYLMKDPELIYAIVKTCKEETNRPVSAKMRLGYDNINFLECAKACEEAGASWVTLHGRTKNGMFTQKVDLDAIKLLKENVSVPVIGNGGLFTPEDAKEMIEKSGCDAIMLARGLIGNPWLIKQCKDYIETGKYDAPDKSEIIRVMIKHLELMVSDKGSVYGVKEFRKHLVKYIKGFEGSRIFRENALKIDKPDELLKEIESLFAL
jgi:tRNA-dihydrouridine synthase B